MVKFLVVRCLIVSCDKIQGGSIPPPPCFHPFLFLTTVLQVFSLFNLIHNHQMDPIHDLLKAKKKKERKNVKRMNQVIGSSWVPVGEREHPWNPNEGRVRIRDYSSSLPLSLSILNFIYWGSMISNSRSSWFKKNEEKIRMKRKREWREGILQYK